jgi:RNA recognition motif-containing protein
MDTADLLETAASKLNTMDPNVSELKIEDPSHVAPKPRTSRKNSRINLMDCKVDRDTGDLISCTAVVVKNIAFALERDQLMAVFDELELTKPFALNYHTDGEGNFRGLAFANFTTEEAALATLEKMNGYEIMGRKIRVEPKKVPLNEMEKSALPGMPAISEITPEQRMKDLKDALEMFKNNTMLTSMSFSATVPRNERMELMKMAEELGLNHATDGGVEGRFLTVMKPSASSRRTSASRAPPNLAPIGTGMLNRRLSIDSNLRFKFGDLNLNKMTAFSPMSDKIEEAVPAQVKINKMATEDSTKEVAKEISDVQFA